MTYDELSKDFADRILVALNPISEAETIKNELQELIEDEDEELTESDKNIIIEKMKYMVREELDRGEGDREVNEDGIIEAVDLLEKGEI